MPRFSESEAIRTSDRLHSRLGLDGVFKSAIILTRRRALDLDIPEFTFAVGNYHPALLGTLSRLAAIKAIQKPIWMYTLKPFILAVFTCIQCLHQILILQNRLPMADSIPFTCKVEDLAFENQSVQNRRGKYLIAQEVSPVIKAFVRCDNK